MRGLDSIRSLEFDRNATSNFDMRRCTTASGFDAEVVSTDCNSTRAELQRLDQLRRVSQPRGVKIFRRIATALRAVVCVMTRMDGSADFSG